MFRVACRICALDVLVKCAIGLFLMSRSKKRRRTCVVARIVFQLWILYVLCRMYDIGFLLLL